MLSELHNKASNITSSWHIDFLPKPMDQRLSTLDNFFRSCCDPGKAWSAKGKRCMDSSNHKLFDAFLNHPAFLNLTSEASLTAANFEKALPRKLCPKGYKRKSKTKPLREG